jgi:hypothetical protein
MKDTLNSPARVWAVRRFRLLSRLKLDAQFYKLSCHRPRENLRSIPARFDLGLERTFKIKEKQAITLEAQAFNLLNSHGRELSNSTVAFCICCFSYPIPEYAERFLLSSLSVSGGGRGRAVTLPPIPI